MRSRWSGHPFCLSLLALGLGVGFASCLGPHDSASLSDLVSDRAEVSLMLEAAEASPPVVVARGHRISSSLPDRRESGPFVGLSRAIAVEVDAESGALVADADGATVIAHSLGEPATESEVEGGALVRRGERGAIRSIVLSRPAAVEDLVVQDADAAAGYQLEMPLGWRVELPRGWRGVAEIKDKSGRPRLRISAQEAWDREGRSWPVSLRLDGQRVLLEVDSAAKRPLLIDPEWQPTSAPAQVRTRATATLLPTGKVLVIGGATNNGFTADFLCTTELYDPGNGTWSAGPVLPEADGEGCTGVVDHAAVPLPDGTVLVAGGATKDALIGADQPAAIARTWRFDPRTESFTAASPMTAARVHHSATLLPDGKVLVAGGTDRMSPFGEINFECPNVGDERCRRCVGEATAEVYDPSTDSWSPLDMPGPRACHAATLLEDGSVIFTGGGGEPIQTGGGTNANLLGTPLTSIVRYADGAFTELPTHLFSPRYGHVAVLNPETNQILVAFGRDEDRFVGETPGTEPAELLDVGELLSASPPATGSPVPVPCPDGDGGGGGGGEGGGGTAESCLIGRTLSAAVLTRSGRALIAGGQGKVPDSVVQNEPLDAVSLFDFTLGAFVPTPELIAPTFKPVLVMLPTGDVLSLGQTVPLALYRDTEVTFDAELEMSSPRSNQATVTMRDGKQLSFGGFANVAEALDSVESFDTTTETFSTLPEPMRVGRASFSATLLPGPTVAEDRVLLIGGQLEDKTVTPSTETTEFFDPNSGTFSEGPSLLHPRAGHAAVRLPTGEVLVVGGYGPDRELRTTAEVYTPGAGFRELPSVSRVFPSATLLPSGDVLVTGGYNAFIGSGPGHATPAVEIYETKTGTLRRTNDMIVARSSHVATVLANGNVLLAGGSVVSPTAEIFDPDTETFRLTAGLMTERRVQPTGTMLPNGKVLIACGARSEDAGSSLSDAEIYDVQSETFTHVPAPENGEPGRFAHTAALLPDGRVALFGGLESPITSTQRTASVSLIRVGIEGGPAFGGAPGILGAPARATPETAAAITGENLASFWATSSGPYPSPTGAPIALWVPASGPPELGSFAPWSASDAEWTPPSTSQAGLGMLFAVRHGVTSDEAQMVEIELAENGVACEADGACRSGFCSDNVCCDERCHIAGDPEHACVACSVAKGAAVDGQCGPVAADTDPFEDCATTAQCAEKFAVCGGDGACKQCLCTSKLDCAPGYACTADGTCEKPVEVDEIEGCSTAPATRPGGCSATWLVAAWLSLCTRRDRRKLRASATASRHGRPSARGCERRTLPIEQSVARKASAR